MRRRKNSSWKKQRNLRNSKKLRSNSKFLKPKCSNYSNKWRAQSKSKVPRTSNSKRLKPPSSPFARPVNMVPILVVIFLNGRRLMISGTWWKTFPLWLQTSGTPRILLIVTILESFKWSCRTERHPRWWRRKTKKTQACSRCKSKTTPK